MIEIKDKRACTGCGACTNACPRHIITMDEDSDGFIYPKVKVEDCIECHLCEKSCPMLKERKDVCTSYDNYPVFYAGQLKDKDNLMEVSSGGAFWAFSKTVIDNGGIVYGAVQTDVDNIYHQRAETLEEIRAIRRSKYFQSDTKLTFAQVKADLKDGKNVLYSGTGCQIAGLKTYLGKEYDNLITCDVVCHGVPSRIVWKTYRKEKEEREGKIIKDLVFRDKSAGWSHNQYKITYQDGSVEKEASTQQLFHAGYLQGLFYRPSCGVCRFASLPRVADVTLADYWLYQGRFRQPGNDLGVSLITVNSNQGQRLLDASVKYLDIELTEQIKALASCRHLDEHPSENPDRENFFKLFNEAGYYVAATKYITSAGNTNLVKRVARKLWRIINKRR